MDAVYLIEEFDFENTYTLGIFLVKEDAIEQAKSRAKKHIKDYETMFEEKLTTLESVSDQLPGITVKEVPVNVLRYVLPDKICYKSWLDEESLK